MEIRPIRDLRDTNKISELCNSIEEPIFITKKGHGDLVIMGNATYERNLALADMYRELFFGQKQIDEGEVVSGEDVFERLRAKYEY